MLQTTLEISRRKMAVSNSSRDNSQWDTAKRVFEISQFS